MNTKIFSTSVLLLFMVFNINAQKKYQSATSPTFTKTYQGVDFTSEKSLAENIQNMNQFTYFNGILENEALIATLASEEMITVFVPTNASFMSMEEEERDAYLANTAQVHTTVKRHVIPGRVDSNSIMTGIEKNGGVIYYKTLANENIGFKFENGSLVIVDSDKNESKIVSQDYMHKNGFFHIVEGLLQPKSNE